MYVLTPPRPSLGCGIGYGYLHRIPTVGNEDLPPLTPTTGEASPPHPTTATAVDPTTAAHAIRAANAGVILSVGWGGRVRDLGGAGLDRYVVLYITTIIILYYIMCPQGP